MSSRTGPSRHRPRAARASTLILPFEPFGQRRADNGVYDTVHKHAVKTAGSWSMTYDANGNMITRAGGSISYYSYNLPNLINSGGNSTQFFYNASHQRWTTPAGIAYGGTFSALSLESPQRSSRLTWSTSLRRIFMELD
jgi:YD repeat-containing protein